MDAFNDNFDQPEVDPAAEFLAREQDDLAGLEDEVKPAMSIPPVSMGNYFCYQMFLKSEFHVFSCASLRQFCFFFYKYVHHDSFP